MNPMPLADALFLLAEGREHPMHVGGLHLYRPPEDAGPDYVAQQYRSSIEHGDILRKLRRRPIRRFGGLGPWEWQDDPDLDLEYHLRHSALPAPGGERELGVLVSRLHSHRLHRAYPLWECHLIEGLENNRFALYMKLHHSQVDGVGGGQAPAVDLRPAGPVRARQHPPRVRHGLGRRRRPAPRRHVRRDHLGRGARALPRPRRRGLTAPHQRWLHLPPSSGG